MSSIINSSYTPLLSAAVFFGGLMYFRNIVEHDIQKEKITIQEAKVILDNCNEKLMKIAPVSEETATTVGTRILEEMATKAGQIEKANQYRQIREELLYNGPLRRNAEEIESQRLVGDITTKINNLIYAVEHDEGEVNEEKYPEMVANICWDVEQLRYRISFQNYKKLQEQLKQIFEEKKMTSVTATPWLNHVNIDKLFRIDYNHHQKVEN
jgi:hypothetical protein